MLYTCSQLPDERWVNVGRIHDAVGQGRMLFIVPMTVGQAPPHDHRTMRQFYETLSVDLKKASTHGFLKRRSLALRIAEP